MRVALMLIVLLCAGCAHRLASPALPALPGWITPAEAVRAANDDPGGGISGTFMLTVQAIGGDEGSIFLNSERDYRHQTNLTLVADNALRANLQKQLGMPLEQLVNRRLLVQGTARRTTIVFSANGVPSSKYYFQTHLPIHDARQVRFAP